MPEDVQGNPLFVIDRLVGSSSAKHHMTKPHIGDTGALDDERLGGKLREAYEQDAKDRARQDEKAKLPAKLKAAEENTQENEPVEVRSRYGMRSMNDLDLFSPFPLENLSAEDVGKSIHFTARIHRVRSMSSRMVFILLRQHLDTIQGVLEYREGIISEQFVRWAEHLNTESVVRIEGFVKNPQEPVKDCSIHTVEIGIESLHLLVQVEETLPVDAYGIDRVDENGAVASNRLREANRITLMRTPTMQSVFRINAGICKIFRNTLDAQGFIEIHTPKLQAAATESGAEVFEVNYFGKKAFLAQSPQLAKQMAISADFERVFEIGPVFRAEDSHTHRHLAEYTGLDLEMSVQKDYHEALDVIDNLLKMTFSQVYSRYRKELDIVKTRFPHEDLLWLDETPILAFKDGVELLNSSGWRGEDGMPASELEDLGTSAEIRLGQLVKEKYKTDYYILDKFPASARPFYTHRDLENEELTNSFDIFLRGQEIVTGGQRINDQHELVAKMEEASVEPDSMREYIRAFESGAPPHAGCGIGLERVVFLLLGLGDIRNASLFPRDAKSFAGMGHEKKIMLPHPEADTIRYSFERHDGRLEMPTVEDLIANYGDATNTSWLDERYEIWRDDHTGAAVGYANTNDYAIVMGNPLCDSKQYPIVIGAFLRDIVFGQKLRPIWILVSSEVEEILGRRLGWQTLTCVAEERVEPDSATKLAKKERQADNAGLKIHELGQGEPVPDDLREKCNQRIAEWQAGREGKQVHITNVAPWVDERHRRYAWAEDSSGEIVGLVVLHQLAPVHGYQIKFALDFPGSPTGSIEALISRSVASLAKAGVKVVTFGATAMPELDIGQNIHGLRVKILARTYRGVVKQLKLEQKSNFREKFGATRDPVYICYPFRGLGVTGARTLVRFFEDEV